jgi:hypothetical protein
MIRWLICAKSCLKEEMMMRDPWRDEAPVSDGFGAAFLWRDIPSPKNTSKSTNTTS